MSFIEIYRRSTPVISLEFFPPKEDSELPATYELIRSLNELGPHLMTCTYGAGGGSRERTRQIVGFICNELKQTAVAHLTCIGHSVAEIDAILDRLSGIGITHVLALRGDPPQGMQEFEAHPQGFKNARELAEHIKRRGDFSIASAGYPEMHKDAVSPQSDIDYLKAKVDTGAEVIFTQLFFDTALYLKFRDRAASAGITVPIVPGIMPIRNVKQIEKFTMMCGATIPGALRARLGECADQNAVIKLGTEYAVAMCKELLAAGVPGLHFYTLNRSAQIQDILAILAL